MSVRSYQDLEVWKESIELVLQVYDCVDRFPPHERFAMSPQVRRAAVSIPSNIAEGQSRSRKEFLHFLAIARGSLQEVATLMIIAERRMYLTVEGAAAIKERADRVGRLLSGLRRSLLRPR